MREILRVVLPFDFGPIAVIASGLVLAGATFIVLFDHSSKDEEDGHSESHHLLDNIYFRLPKVDIDIQI